MKQETIDLIVQQRDAGKSWFDVHRSVPHISAEQCRRIYREAKGLNKQQADVRLRDYFAARAMQGMATWDIKTMDKLANDFGEEPLDYLARNAYSIADAMMKAREQ